MQYENIVYQSTIRSISSSEISSKEIPPYHHLSGRKTSWWLAVHRAASRLSTCLPLARSGHSLTSMIFSKKNAGKWVAIKDGKVVAAGAKLDNVMKKVQSRQDRAAIRFDRVPKQPYVAGAIPLARNL